MPTVTANGISIYYEREGTGPRLLFCNGSGATLERTWPLFEPLAGTFDLAAHDQRGLGRTEIPDPPYTMGQYAADALALADALGWDTFRLMGLSFGGMVAQELAVTRPDRVERLALVCTSPGGSDRASFPLHELSDLPDAERAERMLELLDTRFTPEWLAEHPDQQALASMIQNGLGGDRTPEQRRGEEGQLAARAGHDVYDRLPQVTCPTIVASGRYDGIAPPSNGEAIAHQIPGAELHLYEGGHLFVAQDPTAMPEIREFLSA